MDKLSWINELSTGEVLRPPRKPKPGVKYDTILFDCTFKNANEVIKLKKKLKKKGRILLVIPSKDSEKKFPEEAGKTLEETALREVVDYIIKYSKLKQKLFFKVPKEWNKGYEYFYVALVRE